MSALTQAVNAYIAEHGEIDKDTYEQLCSIYATEASSTAASMDLRVVGTLIDALDKAASVKVNDKTLQGIIDQITKLRNKARSQEDKLKDQVGESY